MLSGYGEVPGAAVWSLWGSCGRVVRRSQKVRDVGRSCRSNVRVVVVKFWGGFPVFCANVTPNWRGCRNITKSFCFPKTH